MSENDEKNTTNDPKNDPKEGNPQSVAQPRKKEPVSVSVSLDTSSMEDIIKRLKEEEQKRKEAEEKLSQLSAKETELKQKLEEEVSKREDFETKLKLIAEKKFAEKKGIIEKRAKELIKDEERVKMILEKLEKPEDLKATEFLLDTLESSLKIGEKQAKEQEEKEEKEKKEKELAEKNADPQGSSGTAPLTGQSKVEGASTEGGYDSYVAMIKDLRRKEKSSNPEEAAEAKAIINEFFKKWARAVKKKYEGQGRGIYMEEEKQPSLREITKKGGAA